jgi:hypothetical protein
MALAMRKVQLLVLVHLAEAAVHADAADIRSKSAVQFPESHHDHGTDSRKDGLRIRRPFRFVILDGGKADNISPER